MKKKSTNQKTSTTKARTKIIKKIKEMKRFTVEQHAKRRKIALVPTMGYLHEGHLSLVREAKRLADVVVVSIFVNPAQFGVHEDLERYPRDFAGDKRKLSKLGVDVVFVPDYFEIYPENYQTFVTVEDVAKDFCGLSRPGHFRGVATIVTKLFNIVTPDMALFGEKDFQQLLVIKKLTADLNLDIDIISMPTVRDEEGLALSSRNAYLSQAQRQKANAIPRGLKKAKRLFDNGERDSSELSAVVLDFLHEEQNLQVEYVAVCDPVTLERVLEVEKEAVVLVAVRIGEVRLIDNLKLIAKRKR